MKWDYDKPSIERLEYFLSKNGLDARKLSKMLWGDKTTREVLKEFNSKTGPKATTLLAICRILDISMDSLFQKSEYIQDLPTISGSHNVVNSSYVNSDVSSLRAEIRALKLLISEKEQRIEDLKKTNEQLGHRLDLVLELGRKADINSSQ